MGFQVDPKYFDYAASAPPWQGAVDEYCEISKSFYANASSIHQQGKATKQKLLELKKEFCDLLHFYDGRLLLTATGSEANNTIIEGHLNKYPKGKILMAMDVHDSMWYASRKHLKSLKLFSPEKSGHYNLKKFVKALDADISIVCVNHVSNETGAIQPIVEIAQLCDERNVKLMVDGMQSVGHIPVNMDEIPCTYYTISGHKFGSVKGAAGVLMRDENFEPLIMGGKQEWGKRAGTEDVAAVASMVKALKRSLEVMADESKRLRQLKNELVQHFEDFPEFVINSSEPDLPGLLSVSFPGFSGREIVGALSLSGFSVSTGSACHANEMEPSRIILSMGRTDREAIGSVRISMGIGTTDVSVKELIEKIIELVR